MAAVSSFYVLFRCYVILQCIDNNVNFQLIYEISTEKSTALFLKNNDTSAPSTLNVHIKYFTFSVFSTFGMILA